MREITLRPGESITIGDTVVKAEQQPATIPAPVERRPLTGTPPWPVPDTSYPSPWPVEPVTITCGAHPSETMDCD